MINKMSGREQDSRKKPVNGLSNHNKPQGYSPQDIDETLTTLLASSLLSPDAENVNDLEEIAGEYSSINNTIDELNKYLDRWDARHDQLRSQIQEALRENEEERKQAEGIDSETPTAICSTSTNDTVSNESETEEDKTESSSEGKENATNIKH